MTSSSESGWLSLSQAAELFGRIPALFDFRSTTQLLSNKNVLTDFVRTFRFFARYELVASCHAGRISSALIFPNWSCAFAKRNCIRLAVISNWKRIFITLCRVMTRDPGEQIGIAGRAGRGNFPGNIVYTVLLAIIIMGSAGAWKKRGITRRIGVSVLIIV